jgi:hypothetical protein
MHKCWPAETFLIKDPDSAAASMTHRETVMAGWPRAEIRRWPLATLRIAASGADVFYTGPSRA